MRVCVGIPVVSGLVAVVVAVASATAAWSCSRQEPANRSSANSGAGRSRTLEFRLLSDEPYVSFGVEKFARQDPRFADRIVSVLVPTNERLEAEDREGSSGSQVLQAFIDAWRGSPELRADPAAMSLWSRVFIGQPDGRRAEGIPAVWRTYLLEPEALVTGDRVAKAEVSYDPNAIRDMIWVAVEFDAAGAEQFARATGAHVGSRLAIVVNGVVQSAPMIVEPITGGKVRITLGLGSAMEIQKEAEDLVRSLGGGGSATP